MFFFVILAGIGFIPGVAVIVIGSIVLVAIICLIAYFWKRAKRGSFAKGITSRKKALKQSPNQFPLPSFFCLDLGASWSSLGTNVFVHHAFYDTVCTRAKPQYTCLSYSGNTVCFTVSI